MKLARVLYPVESLGPGRRAAVWVQGCDRKCPGCANPELWDPEGITDIPWEYLAAMLRSAVRCYGLDGITITGGEPFLQAGDLSCALEKVGPLCGDVLIFTGFSVDELKKSDDPGVHRLLKRASVLVDGPYIRELNACEPLRGSSNQRILFFDESLREKYEAYIARPQRSFDHFAARDGVISVGIHPPEFADDMDRDPADAPADE